MPSLLLAAFLLLPPDPLRVALDTVGLSTSDLGYRPKGYWNRYPQPQGIPHKLPFFDDLFAEPLRVYDFTRTLANAVHDYLTPEMIWEKGIALHRLVYFLGVDRMVTGFRNYSANLAPRISGENPLYDAVVRIYETTGQMNFASFGGEYDSLPLYREIRKQTETLPPNLNRILAQLVLNLLDAHRWWEIATQGIPWKDALEVFYILDLPQTQSGGDRYYPSVDRVAAALDWHSLFYSAMKAADAVNRALRDLDTLTLRGEAHLDLPTPLGRILLLGKSADTVKVHDVFLLVDLGGNDLYLGEIGAPSRPGRGISVAIDLAGDDQYRGTWDALPTQGAGILGTGILADAKGNDRYEAGDRAQGFGFLGVGLLFDGEGDDRYRAEESAQGCGYLGLGLLLEAEGDDDYYLYGSGQGDGEFGGIGVLADRKGDDHYKAEPLAEVFDRGDYHSKYKINANNAQGFGGGRRGDGSDGHSWAGGLGALIDIEGNDRYESGNWSLGTGYWYGIGLLYDGAGDDLYRSCYFTQASGAHYAIGALIDEGGNDQHLLFETAGAALGFGWDFTVALFLDQRGNDEYEGKIISMGVAEVRSNAFFFDLGGRDRYRMNAGTLRWGASDFRKDYRTPNPYSPYMHHTYSLSLGLFVDAGGEDRYEEVLKNGEIRASQRAGNNRLWLQPDPASSEWGARNYGVGVDVPEGQIPEFRLFPLP